jgi:hypothetical protein
MRAECFAAAPKAAETTALSICFSSHNFERGFCMKAIFGTFLSFALSMLTSDVLAWSCNSDCKQECKIAKAFGKTIRDPGCMAGCSTFKKTCASGINLPPIHTPSPDPRRIPQQFCMDEFARITAEMEALCRVTTGFQARDSNLDGAKQILVALGAFSETEFQNIAIRFCNLPGGDGFTPNPNKILLSDRLYSADPRHLAAILAHEMHHIRQHREWGYQKFACRYGQQLFQGHGFRERNDVERPAYEFEEAIRDQINKSALQGR